MTPQIQYKITNNNQTNGYISPILTLANSLTIYMI